MLFQVKPERESLFEEVSNDKSRMEKPARQKIDHRKVFEFLKKRKKEEA